MHVLCLTLTRTQARWHTLAGLLVEVFAQQAPRCQCIGRHSPLCANPDYQAQGPDGGDGVRSTAVRSGSCACGERAPRLALSALIRHATCTMRAAVANEAQDRRKCGDGSAAVGNRNCKEALCNGHEEASWNHVSACVPHTRRLLVWNVGSDSFDEGIEIREKRIRATARVLHIARVAN